MYLLNANSCKMAAPRCLDKLEQMKFSDSHFAGASKFKIPFHFLNKEVYCYSPTGNPTAMEP